MKKLNIVSQVIAILLAGFAPGRLAVAQDAPGASLADHLQAQYKLTKIGSDSSRLTIVEPGTVLVIQKEGILGVPPGNMAIAPATYMDGKLHSPGAAARSLLGNNTRLLEIGEKVYALKLDVNIKNELVSLTIMECDSCNGITQPLSYKSQVNFQFPKGYLELAEVEQVEEVIGKVFNVDDGNGAQQAQDPQGGQGPASGQSAPAQPQAPLVQIHLGQTVDEVKAALGQPEKIVSLGSKQIYVYKDLKITFVNGKVADAQ